MMTEEHVLIGRNVIETVIMARGRRLSRTIDSECPVGDEQSIKPIGDEIDANRGDDQPRGVDRFTSIERHDRKCHST
jgi:hypothetical protein